MPLTIDLNCVKSCSASLTVEDTAVTEFEPIGTDSLYILLYSAPAAASSSSAFCFIAINTLPLGTPGAKSP